MELTFLGTGGGRFAMVEQLRQTGGFVLSHEGFTMHVDPAPGALVYALQNDVDLSGLDAVFSSHGHTDHYGDLDVIIEAMTDGCTEDRGTLIASESVLGRGGHPTVIPDYHLNGPAETVCAREGSSFEPENMEGGFRFFETDHKDVATAGFRLETEGSSLTYLPDTETFEGLEEKLGDPNFLIINTLRPAEKSWKGHLNLEEAVDIVRNVDPEQAFFQHFGINFIYNFGEQKEWLEENYDKDNITLASDNKTYNLDEEGGLKKFVD